VELHQIPDPQGRHGLQPLCPATKPEELIADIEKLLAE
jgi:hypothetical protein